MVLLPLSPPPAYIFSGPATKKGFFFNRKQNSPNHSKFKKYINNVFCFVFLIFVKNNYFQTQPYFWLKIDIFQLFQGADFKNNQTNKQ